VAHYADKLEMTGDEFFFFAEVISVLDREYRRLSQEKDSQKPKPSGGK
jgi:hypothetical protein